MAQWTKWVAAGCCLGLMAAVSGCSGQDISGPKTAAESKSFAGGPMPANSPWAKKLQAARNAGQNFKPPVPPGAAANQPTAPHSL